MQQRFVLALTISPDDVGSRVSVRRRLPDGGMTDAVGQLLRWSDGTLVVARRDGTLTEIAEDSVVAGKVVPPPPTRMSGGLAQVRELQRIAALGWPAQDTTELGGWLLRATGGWTLRANSVLVLDAPGLPVPEALAVVDRWYRERDLAPAFSIPEPLDDGLGAALTDLGWPTTGRRILVLTAAANTVLPPDPGGEPVRLDTAPDEAWLAGYGSRGGISEVGRTVLTGPQSAVFASVRHGGAATAIARSTLDSGRLGISAVETGPTARRRGLAGHVVRHLVAHGRTAGAEQVYLQVAADNTAAIELYRGLGFAQHHAYQYRTAPEAKPSVGTEAS
ncbi:MAG TPA: GNAT family N-acetyltransferase [Sporichthyaceae bacterium]|nr:GNAT family N-acetyltransferase [Sporichthyaceae bacterium]